MKAKIASWVDRHWNRIFAFAMFLLALITIGKFIHHGVKVNLCRSELILIGVPAGDLDAFLRATKYNACDIIRSNGVKMEFMRWAMPGKNNGSIPAWSKS